MMKGNIIKINSKLLYGFVFLYSMFFFTSCKTNLVYINVTNPAPVTISNSVKKVGIINRSIPSDDNKSLISIHQNRSGETLELIKESSNECIKGLREALIENKRFDVITPLSQVNIRTPVMGTFPTQLSWSEIEAICKTYDVDIVFALEIFDTELRVVPLVNTTKITNATDVLNSVTQQQVNITTIVKTGWRIYDPANKVLLDEFPLTDKLTITANAVNAVNTVESLLGRKEAIKQSSNSMGVVYAQRLLPVWTRVTRDYYIKGTSNFKIATRRARTGNWQGAGELWLKETTNSKRKIAGRACYDMAILSEINGDLDTAIQWAQKSYEDYNNKLALKYINMLRYRKQSNKQLEYQMEK